jgi:hypothetical protein
MIRVYELDVYKLVGALSDEQTKDQKYADPISNFEFLISNNRHFYV